MRIIDAFGYFGISKEWFYFTISRKNFPAHEYSKKIKNRKKIILEKEFLFLAFPVIVVTP
jgi:hypothetical protein